VPIFKSKNDQNEVTINTETKVDPYTNLDTNTAKPSVVKHILKSLVFFLPLLVLVGLFATGNIGSSKDGAKNANSEQNKNQNRRGNRGNRGGPPWGGPKKEILIPVETDSAKRETLYAYYTGTASLYADNKTDVAAKIGGQITRINFEEGDVVKAGQVLATIESDRFRLEVKRAEANLNKITQDIERKQELYEQKLIPRDSFESLRYDKQSAEAALALSKLDLSYTSIRAPISGIISSRKVQRGNTIGANQAVYEITSLSTLQADLFVPERELDKIKIGQNAQVSFDAVNTKDNLNASIKRISPVIDSQTGTFKTTLELDNKDGSLKPGMFGRFNVVFDKRDNVLTLTRSAIQDLDMKIMEGLKFLVV